MKYLKYITLALILSSPFAVKAKCDYKEMSDLRKIASNIQFSYNYYYKSTSGIDSEVRFKITIANLNPKVFIRDVDKIENYYYKNSNELIKNDYAPGGSYKFELYTNSDNCRGELLFTRYVALPTYNRFSEDEICNDATEFYLCNKWQKVNISYDEFKNKVNEYKESSKVVIEKPKEEPTLKDKILSFIFEYYYYILLVIIALTSSLLIALIKRENKDFK